MQITTHMCMGTCTYLLYHDNIFSQMVEVIMPNNVMLKASLASYM